MPVGVSWCHPCVGGVAVWRSDNLAARHPNTYLLVGLEHGEEGFLGDFDLADLLHALLAGRLLGQQFALAGNIAAIAFR